MGEDEVQLNSYEKIGLTDTGTGVRFMIICKSMQRTKTF